MWSIMRATLLIAILLAGSAIAQKDCFQDADCSDHQYCYLTGNVCVNFTKCSDNNREESSKPARHPNQCGPCIKGYSAERNYAEEADMCIKDRSVEQEKNQSYHTLWDISLIIIGSVLALLMIVILGYFIARCKYPWLRCTTSSKHPANRSSLPLVNTNHSPSAPPLPSKMSLNNNEDADAEEIKPLAMGTAKKHGGDFIMDTNHLVKAQGYHPPYNVCIDPSYNPESDTQVIETTFNPPDIDEETMSSDWTPSRSTVHVVSRPFADISEEQHDNTTNAVIDRIVCPSPSTSEENREWRQNNNSSGNSEGFGYNETTGNVRGNSNSTAINLQVQVMNVIQQNGNNS